MIGKGMGDEINMGRCRAAPALLLKLRSHRRVLKGEYFLRVL
jgi:hypothetical protein